MNSRSSSKAAFSWLHSNRVSAPSGNVEDIFRSRGILTLRLLAGGRKPSRKGVGPPLQSPDTGWPSLLYAIEFCHHDSSPNSPVGSVHASSRALSLRVPGTQLLLPLPPLPSEVLITPCLPNIPLFPPDRPLPGTPRAPVFRATATPFQKEDGGLVYCKFYRLLIKILCIILSHVDWGGGPEFGSWGWGQRRGIYSPAALQSPADFPGGRAQ